MTNRTQPSVKGIFIAPLEVQPYVDIYLRVLRQSFSRVLDFYDKNAGVQIRRHPDGLIPVYLPYSLQMLADSDNLPALVFRRMWEQSMKRDLNNPLDDPWIDLDRMWPDTWLVYIPGGGGFAGGNRSDRTAENVHTSIVGDYGIGPLMRSAGYPQHDYTRSFLSTEKIEALEWANTANVADSTMMHEAGHAMFDLPDNYLLENPSHPNDIMTDHAGYIQSADNRGFQKAEQFRIRFDALIQSYSQRPRAVGEGFWNYSYSRYLNWRLK